MAARDWGQGTKWMSADFQGSRTAPCDTTVGTRANPQGAQGAGDFNGGAEGNANGFDGDYTVVDDDK